MAAKHTAGPWFAVTRSDLPADVYADGVSIFDIHGEEGDANARLIAAAPEYHELAEDALPILEAVLEDREEVNGEEDEILRCLIDRFRAAIARAGGAS